MPCPHPRVESLICFRLPLLAAIAAAVVLLVAGSAFAQETPRQPNIVVILADDLGYGDLSSYGAQDLESPSIDALVADGMRFDRFYANCPVCSPTRASLLSGRYPELVGVPGVIRTHAEDNWGYLSPDAVMLPERLREAGYHTALVGKWHLGLQSPNTPNERGFDHFHGWLGDMMDDYYTHLRHNINYMRLNEQEIEPQGHATDLFTAWAQEYVTERAKSDQPFFLYLAYNAPHTPIQPPPDWVQRVKQREPGIGEQRATLVALVEHMDHGIGQFVETLKKNGQYENTLIVFTSDNGGKTDIGASNGRLRGAKQQMYEGGLRVPLAVVWPGRIAAGSRGELQAMTMDLFPTLCQVAGVSAGEQLDGRSFLPTLLGESQKPLRRESFWTRREGNNRYLGQAIWAIQRDNWKLLQNLPTEPFQLFNLADDPQEQRDLASSEPKKFEELAAALRRHIQRGGSVPWQKP